jgi:hypothetical protein
MLFKHKYLENIYLCLRCYEFNANTIGRKSASTSLETNISLERPIRFRVNFNFYTQMANFLRTLNLASVKPTPEAVNSPILNTECEPETFSFMQQVIFDLNIYLVTSQIIFLLEICDTQDLSKHINFYACLNSINVYLNRSNELLSNNRNTSILKEYFVKSELKKNAVNCARVVLNDFQCRFHYNKHESGDFMPFFGPVTLKLDLSHNSFENELYSVVCVDSFSLTINKYLVNVITRMIHYISQHLSPMVRKTKNFHLFQRCVIDFKT